MTSAHCLFAS